MYLDKIKEFLGQSTFTSELTLACALIIICLITYLLTRHIVIRALSGMTQKTQTLWDDLILSKPFLRRLSYVPPLIVIYSSASLFHSSEDIIRKISVALILLFLLMASGTFLASLGNVYTTFEFSKGRPIKGYIQIAKIIIYIAGGIIIVTGLIGKSPLGLLSGFGAMTAIILLIFRDTILSFTASLQITSNDLIRVGDWIESPKYGADGSVVDIALHTVKIQNWDKTYSIIPTHKLLEESFKNWSGMQSSGGRRIKRAVHIDLGSIRFCNREMVDKFKKFALIKEYVEQKEKELDAYNKGHDIDTGVIVNGRRMTNIGTFRAYIQAYLRNNEKIRDDMTFLVRQLQPGPDGLPIELYVFSADTVWSNYESIQADIFDHILAVVPQFELRVFQNPTGWDFQKMAGEAA
jgi:miniconductance mechanosensitive channel